MPRRCELLSHVCRRLPWRLLMSPLALVCREAVVPALGGPPAAASPRGLTGSGRRRSSGHCAGSHAARGELTSKGTAPSSVPTRSLEGPQEPHAHKYSVPQNPAPRRAAAMTVQSGVH